ncbi:uncharacterized protein isoform X2 [Leptinotarsa decemlineata]|uniref:uncharacterized protein isoform X2 n=1 Tax=Leptinotarsa decemlineata TaxID=7539 RepID=UPI003D30A040
MENEIWAPKYQQSVPTSLERTEDHLNNGNTENEGEEGESKKAGEKEYENFVKSEPDLDSGPTSLTISETAKQTIHTILELINPLSQVEKFLLFLKLPGEVTNAVDPFRQTLNPLGSRSEIYRTISWIKTHLEEDPDTSLPKQEVYNDYHNYCVTNTIKPLSQADFGKVMKQVYPKVRARRLGTRGNSRYCYSGLRRCMKLKTPKLPDLADKPMSTEAPFTQTSLTSAAWLIVKEWSEQQLNQKFDSIQALAYHLIMNHAVGTGSEAASKIASVSESSLKGEEGNYKNCSKHREMQLQLQRKIQQKNEGKERKRKMQSPKSEQKPSVKKTRSQSVPAPTALSPTMNSASGLISGECSTASSSTSTSPTQGKTICDKSLDFTQVPALPDFNSFQKPAAEGALGGGRQETPVSTVHKVAIPRLQPATVQTSTPPRKLAKYKSLRPRLQHCDIASYNPQPIQTASVEENRSQDLNDIGRIKESNSDDEECDVPDFPLTRERLDSVSNVSKDAMDEYLGTNSQHEEELSKYFSNNNVNEPIDSENTDKLSTLRQLLEQNIVDNKSLVTTALQHRVIQESIPFSNASLNQTPVQNEITHITPIIRQGVLPHMQTNIRRRVSFDTHVTEETSVPPSPNTRRKDFNFTPISPGPQSPSGIQSKCSSTTASPFVSPRSTPVMRTKTVYQNVGILKNELRKPLKVKREINLTVEIPNESQFLNSSSLPMSAPVSPMLSNKSVLHKLLNSSSKVEYSPGYSVPQSVAVQPDTSQDEQFYASNIESNLEMYRSQSVPLHDMVAPIDEILVPEQSVPVDDFPEIDPIPDTDSDNVKRILNSLDDHSCDNNNIDLYNVHLPSNNAGLSEFGIQIANGHQQISSYTQGDVSFTNVQMARNVRSHSIGDIIMTYQPKCLPSRSVPSTPLPFSQIVEEPLKANYTNSRSYPSTPRNTGETFTYGVNGDCLLNGQPIRTDSVENLEFVQNFELNEENNIEQLPQDKSFTMDGMIPVSS